MCEPQAGVFGAEWAGRGVRVNAIAPGFIDTPQSRERLWPTPEMVGKITAATPRGASARSRTPPTSSSTWPRRPAATSAERSSSPTAGIAWGAGRSTLLRVLLESNSGVDRERLMIAVWPHGASASALEKTIERLRKALGPHAYRLQTIERGYEFVV